MSVYLWAVLHDRPTYWACDPQNWPADLRTSGLPSQATMSRRLSTSEVQGLLHRLEQTLAAGQFGSCLRQVDGKAILVAAHSKDSEACWGRASRGYGRGYKLHAIYGQGPLPECWEVTSLNVSEIDVAARLIPLLKRDSGYIVGDKNYDSNQLHNLAVARGCQLLAERRRPGEGLGHRRHSVGRLRCIELLRSDFGKGLIRAQRGIERQFSWLSCHGAGLSPLPAWVRRGHRVRLWVQAKLIIHAIYVYLKRPTNMTANA